MSNIIELYVLDRDLQVIGIIDNYQSLIWSNRYNDDGDCEVYVEATTDTINLLRKNYYLARRDDDMVCRIKKVELDTDAEEGNYLIVTGTDVKGVLSQRIIWSQTNVEGKVEDHIRDMVYKTLVNPNLSARQIKNASGRANFYLGTAAGFTEVITEQVTYDNVREKVQYLCKNYEWGYKVIVDYTLYNFYFVLYKGTDRSTNVIFSPDFENIISTSYIEDSTNLANVALVAGEGEGSDRTRNVSGYAEGLDRYELYVDARDISKTITWGDLTTMYPTTDQGGQGYIATEGSGTGMYYVYKMNYINIQIVDDNQLTELRATYPSGQVVTISGVRYYQVYNATIADLPSNTLQSGDNVVLRDIVYSVYLLTRGYEKMTEFGSIISFEGVVSPNVTFVYKTDYFLGDEVMVENEYGIRKKARIVEVIEVCDENGYSIEPKFEYKNVSGEYTQFILTETLSYIDVEWGTHLETEG